MNIRQTARKPFLFAVATLVMLTSLVATPASAFARKVGPGKYVVITDPLTLTLDCDQESWNPLCMTETVSNRGLDVSSFFYIDGRLRNRGDVNFDTVCSLFRLADGWHTAKLTARDSEGNTSRIGPYPVIHCDRSGPRVFTGLRRVRGTYVANPSASDRWSGVDATTMDFSVDSSPVEWKSYWNLCQQLTLGPGVHVAVAQATDNAGNHGSRAATFVCH